MELQNQQIPDRSNLDVDQKTEVIKPSKASIIKTKLKATIPIFISVILASSITGFGVYSWQKSINDQLSKDSNTKNVVSDGSIDNNAKNVIPDKNIDDKSITTARINDRASSLIIRYPSGSLPNISVSSYEDRCNPYISWINFSSSSNDPDSVDFKVATEESVSRYNNQIEIQNSGSYVADEETCVFAIPDSVPLDFAKIKQLFTDEQGSPKTDYIMKTYEGKDFHISPKVIGSRTWYVYGKSDASGPLPPTMFTTYIDGKMIDINFHMSNSKVVSETDASVETLLAAFVISY